MTIKPRKYWLRWFTVVVCAGCFSSVAAAAVTYYFDWYCPGCSRIGAGGGNGREGPFGSPAACESARASMGASLNTRGCGPDCFNPLLCYSEGVPETPRSPGPVPGQGEAAGARYVVPLPGYDYRAERKRWADEIELQREEEQGEESGAMEGCRPVTFSLGTWQRNLPGSSPNLERK
jgi:hypothetical protein